MCFVKPPPEPEAIQTPASIADPAVQQARVNQNDRAKAAAGSQSTILSSLMKPPTTMAKQLMGA